MSQSLPELLPPQADLDRELAAAAAVVAERPSSWKGVARKKGLADDVYFANIGYYTAYPGAALQIAPGDEAAAAAWKRIRAHVLKLLLTQVPTSPKWDPARPTWPLPTPPKEVTPGKLWSAGSAFEARRPWSKSKAQTRYHTGTDLRAAAGVPILAPESGVVVAPEHGWEYNPATKKGVKSVLMHTDSGYTILLGGSRPGSSVVKAGERVVAGQQLAEVGTYPLGDSMLHFQLWAGQLPESAVNKAQSWAVGAPRPTALLDPRDYLLAAAQNPKMGVVGLVGEQGAPDDGALVANDVEGGEQAEGVTAADEGSSSGLVWAIVGGAVVVAGGAAVLYFNNREARPRKKSERRRRRAA